ncbi:MAG: lytic murein transglycosylase B [Gammaproteobacteria bacterium]|nr:lytic murein transglycosylase B [Gammaproteobacteria bacterium]
MRKFLILVLYCVSGFATEHPGTDEFVNRAVSEYGLQESEVRALLEQAEYKQSIVDAISRPAEGKPWHEYRKIFLTDKRISQGIEFWKENRELISAVSKQFGVDEEVIVSIIGVETSYGRNTGGYRTVDALVTLGFYYPQNLSSDRSPFFSSELLHYMRLASEEGLPADEITGSYAGAMGMGQFMPSSYREYAVDFDSDGKRDLWRSTADVVGSVANYLHRHGWQPGKPVTRRARASSDAAFDKISTRGLKPTLTVAEWQEKGFTSSSELSPAIPAAVLKLVEKDRNSYWLTFKNFYVITRYNRSPRYAMAVHQLSQEIKKGMDKS